MLDEPRYYKVLLCALRSEAARHWEHPAARVRLVFDTTLLHDAVLERPASSRGTMRLPDYNIGNMVKYAPAAIRAAQ